MERKNWAEKFADEVRHLPAIVLLLLLSGVIAAAGTVFSAAQCTWDAYDAHFQWREDEYNKIADLRAGISIERFREILGSPIFVRHNDDGSLVENSFQGRDYWVQAVEDSSGTVLLFSVTACDVDFRPKFEIPDGRSNKFAVTLNKTYLSDVRATPLRVMYSLPGATGNRNFYDEYGFGNPGYYKVYYIAIDDACPIRAINIDPLANQGLSFYRAVPVPYSTPAPALKTIDGVSYTERLAIDAFRRQAITNTYAEFFGVSGGPPITSTDVLADFQVGIDRILIRTVR